MNEINKPRIINTTIEDLPRIHQLFEASIIYQEKNHYPSWRNYDREAVLSDLKLNNQYKVIIENSVAMVFSIRTEDRIIWRERENGDALYLHRIVVNPQFKGQRIFGHVVERSIAYCRRREMRFLRMDTWANSPNLIKYYTGFGFRFVENVTTPNSEQLPVHNRGITLALLEMDVDGNN